MIVWWLFVIANVLYFIASFPLLIKIAKNRKSLEDFSFVGSIITFFALFIMSIAYALMYNWIALILCVPGLMMWFLASIFSISKKKFK